VKKDGVKAVVEAQHRVMPWWRMTGNGTFVFFVRASQKTIEFEKGKAGIAVASLDKLPPLIDPDHCCSQRRTRRATGAHRQISAGAKGEEGGLIGNGWGSESVLCSLFQ